MVALQASGSAQRQAVEKACRLGDGQSCEMAASLRSSSGDLTADPCYEAFVRRACALGVASSCTLARQCDPLAAASPPSAGAESVAAFLRSTSIAAARAHVDPGFERTGVVLRLLAGPAGRSATDVETLVDALLSSPDEDESWTPRPGCVVAPGRASDRDEVAPLLFQGAVSPRLQELAIRMRSQLDAAEVWVARCRCYSTEVFLLDAKRRKIVASQVHPLPAPRRSPIRDAKADRRRDINLDSHPTGATLRWRGRLRRLPLRLRDVRDSDLLGATLSADGHEPFTITAGALKQPVFGEFGPEQTGEASWYVVLRPSRPARGGGR